MSCPYFQSSCPEPTLPADASSCPSCRRFLKRCPACGVRNRAFANACRSCGSVLTVAPGNWTSCKGSSQRLGLNGFAPAQEPRRGSSLEVRETNLQLQLGENCRSLLGYDRHLVAISQGGSVEVCDPGMPASGVRFKADGPISCDPCIDRGVLYLGSRGRLAAYSLGALTLANPRLAPLWQIQLSGIPIQALTILGNRLYVTVSREDGSREVQVVENLERNPPSPARAVHVSQRLSWTAADPVSQELVFLSQQGESTQLHTLVHGGPRMELASRTLPGIPGPFADQVPIALLGGKVFGVFGDEEKLCRLDARTGEFEQSLGADTKLFALCQDRGRAWDGDGVQIGTGGVLFLRAGFKEPLPPLERVVKGSPVVVQGRAVVLGLQDGRLRIYDLRHLPRNDVRRLGGDGEPISALASFHNYVAAGNAKGVVKVFELFEDDAAA